MSKKRKPPAPIKQPIKLKEAAENRMVLIPQSALEELRQQAGDLRGAREQLAIVTNERDVAVKLAGATAPELHAKIAQCDAMLTRLDEIEAQAAALMARNAELESQITPIWHKGEPPRGGSIEMRSGSMLYWSTNEAGGRTYSSDEIPTGVHVWDTALVDYATLLEAITLEFALIGSERRARERHERTEKAIIEDHHRAVAAQRAANPDAPDAFDACSQDTPERTRLQLLARAVYSALARAGQLADYLQQIEGGADVAQGVICNIPCAAAPLVEVMHPDDCDD